MDALAKGLDDLLSDPHQMKRFSNSALKKAKTFDVNQLAKQMVAVYEEAIEAKRAGESVTLKAEEAAPQQAISSEA